VGQSASDEVKALLREHTEKAISGGSPGVPWIKARNLEEQEECYWGFDHLGQAARFLGLGKLSGAHL
jgi:2-hydroxychromene-2-carboxylate isomerase